MGKPLALVIEDDFGIAQLLALAAKTAGYEAELVRSGQTAHRRVLGAAPDLVLLDLRLPGASGRMYADRP